MEWRCITVGCNLLISFFNSIASFNFSDGQIQQQPPVINGKNNSNKLYQNNK
ncbi:hypothetical protein AB8Q19_00030 [Candidatus Profftella armatura]